LKFLNNHLLYGVNIKNQKLKIKNSDQKYKNFLFFIFNFHL